MQIQHCVKKDSKIRIGFVGFGKISTNHFKTLAEFSDDYELAAVCDNHQLSLERTTDTLKVAGYRDLKTMLNSEQLDAVTLCSPSGLHAQQTIEIARAGKHVITEKPMATRWADGISMINECDKANVKLFVVKQVRYQPAFKLLYDAIRNKRFGRIYLVNMNVFWTRSQSYYDQSKWRGTWEFDGGAFMNQASHYIDILQWLFGSVQNVHAMMSTMAMNIESEDTGILNIRWRSGTLGTMNVTMLTYPKNLETSLTVLGEKGSVKISGSGATEIHHWEFDKPDAQDELAAAMKNGAPLENHYGHKCYYENVAKTLRGESDADIDGREGLRSLELLIAAYLSAKDNREVSLPLMY